MDHALRTTGRITLLSLACYGVARFLGDLAARSGGAQRGAPKPMPARSLVDDVPSPRVSPVVAAANDPDADYYAWRDGSVAKADELAAPVDE